MNTPRVMNGVLTLTRTRTVSYAALLNRLRILPPSLSRSLRLLAHRGQAPVFNSRRCTR